MSFYNRIITSRVGYVTLTLSAAVFASGAAHKLR